MKNQNQVGRNGSKAGSHKQARTRTSRSNGRATAQRREPGGRYVTLEVELDDATRVRVERAAAGLGVTPGEFIEAAATAKLIREGFEAHVHLLSPGAQRALHQTEEKGRRSG